MLTWLPVAALALDLIAADPPFLPHPVRGIGFMANKLEGPARTLGARTRRPVLVGTLALAAICLTSASIAALLCGLPSFLGTICALYLAWSGLALGCLVREGRHALELVKETESNPAALPSARRAVGMLVSRDVTAMTTPDLYRSLAESLSENLNDAFVAPFFWLCLGGPIWLWIYKSVSTLDSMWGYKNERFALLGRASARCDDALAYVPARLCVCLMLLTAWVCQKLEHFSTANFFSISGWPGWRTVARQVKGMESPNAGWPMATAAWLLNGRSGGPTPYEGIIKEKAQLGPDNGCWTAENCARLLVHARATGLTALVLSVAL